MFGPLAKWVAQVDQVERIPELIARAFRVATSGRPGPGRARAARGRARRRRRRAGRLAVRAGAGGAGDGRADGGPRAARIAPSVRSRSSVASPGARMPGRLSRPGARRAGSRSPLRGAARITSTTRPSCYAGHLGVGADPALRDRLRDADVLLVVGARLGDIETGGFATIVPPGVGRTLIHVHSDPDEIGRVYEPALGIVSSGPRFAEALRPVEPLDPGVRSATMDAAHAAWRATLETRVLPGAVETTGVMSTLRARLGPDAILTSGAGNFTVWAHRFYVFRRYRTQLAPLSGAMGYGLPAAIAAKLVHPDRDVVVPRRRRRLPDDRAGARDGAAGGRARGRGRARQRYVRDDPHAPGAALPRSRQRHRPRQPGLRRPRRVHSARTASASSGRKTFPPRSTARSVRAPPRCSTSRSTPRR